MSKLWENIRPGKPRKFKTPKELWEAGKEYFVWCDENPLQEEKLFAFQGKITSETVDKMRAYTLLGFSLRTNVASSYLRALKSVSNKKVAESKDKKQVKEAQEYLTVIKWIEETVYTQKFEGASADLLNARIISRDLGLIEKRDVTSDGEQITPQIIVSDSSLRDKLEKE